jgi:Fe-S-cluster-containing dehydrogenase component
MKKWNMIIDVAECTNCNLCTLAAMDEYAGNEWPGYSAPMPKHGHKWINILQKERGQTPMIDVAYVPTMCNHCDDPPCMKAAPKGAVTKRRDGIVIIDPEKAKGQRQLVDACPYGHIWWNEELQLPQAWPFDAHLLDGLETDARTAVLPDRRHARDQGRGRGHGPPRPRARARSA